MADLPRGTSPHERQTETMSESDAAGMSSGSSDALPETLRARLARVLGPGGRLADHDPWIAYATYGVIAAIVVVVAYLAFALYSSSHTASTQSNAARAVANLTALVAKTPTDAQAHVRLGEALTANGQSDAAADQFATALRLDPSNAAARTDLGLLEMSARDWKAAESSWLTLVASLSGEQMAAQDQRLADVYYYLGTTLVEEGRFGEAASRLRQSIAIRSDASPVHYMLSVAYSRQHLLAAQRTELETVLEFDPKHAQANYDLAMLDLGASQVATAAELFRVAADNVPAGITEPQKQLAALGNAEQHLATAFTLRVSNPRRALEEARIAAALDPKNQRAVQLVAGLWDLLGDTPRSLNAWQRLLEIAPGDPTATAAIARLSSRVD